MKVFKVIKCETTKCKNYIPFPVLACTRTLGQVKSKLPGTFSSTALLFRNCEGLLYFEESIVLAQVENDKRQEFVITR